MRKILLIIIIILLLVLGYFSVAKGVQIGSFNISSIMQIDEESKKLDRKTEELNSLIDTQENKQKVELQQASDKMEEAKKRYLDETNLSSNEEIQSALQIESFDIEKLWTKVGNHATQEGVNIKLTLNASMSDSTDTKDLSFTVAGSYIGITNFIYSLEDDKELNFRIYNFKLLPKENDILEATFIVKDVRITQSSLNESLKVSGQNSEENTNTEDKTEKQ